jgi:polysaccharide deacetylase 2 family uncharacterized protein YibQ
MPRKKKKKITNNAPLRVKLFAAVLVLVVLAGIGTVKLFQTTRGRIILLDAGFTAYYDMVQQELDVELRKPLEFLGLERALRQKIEVTTVGGREYRVRHWQASCSGSCSPAKIGLAFTKAARAKGAVARSRIEESKSTGETIVITVGSRRYPTHRITITRPGRAQREPVTEPPRPRLALVIDDFGYSKNETVESFLTIDLPLTISILPSLPRSRYVLERARTLGKETMLHLPMEAKGVPVQAEWVTTAMSEDSIRALVQRYIEESTGVAGVNNHQGSLATQDPRVMRAVISVLKGHGLFFLDSLTSSKSIAYNTARSLDVPAAKNDLSLDDDTEDPAVVEERLMRLLALAKRTGSAIGIGHPKRWTYQAISANEKLLRESGVDLVFVSELME